MPVSRATSTPDPAARPRGPAYTFVGGKGGVGKTTCAAALALQSARRGRRTLVISTDPAPSLGDALAQPLSPHPRPVRGLRRLHAVEVHAAAALERWLAARRETFATIALRGTWLDEQDVSGLLRLSLPGIDEMAALLEIRRLAAAVRAETVIVDTAPTGHLIRMLQMPAVLEGVTRVFEHLQAKHRAVVGALRGGWTPDEADRLIAELAADARDLRDLLCDSSRTRLTWVTLAEPMAVAETRDALAWLRRARIPVEGVIVNRVTAPPPQRCRWCTARRRFEQGVVSRLRQDAGLGRRPLRALSAADAEPRGPAALMALRLALVPDAGTVRPRARGTLRVVRAGMPRVALQPRAPAALALPTTRLLMFGGKGGVGKTTCAAAEALALAHADPDRRILLLSTDPAHSLGDAFERTFSNRPARAAGGPPNLLVRELDAARVYGQLRGSLGTALRTILPAAVPDAGASSIRDAEGLQDLLDLAPPGIDELAATMQVVEELSGGRAGRYDVIVMDTAPTGHALRLIEMPALVHDWVKLLMAILLKYRSVVGLGELGTRLLRFSRGLGQLRQLLADPARASFVIVTRSGVLPRAETVRLLERLDAAGVSTPAILFNAPGGGTCGRCGSARRQEERDIRAIGRAAADAAVDRRLVLAPAQLPPPRGAGPLARWRRLWRLHAQPGRPRAISCGAGVRRFPHQTPTG